MIIVISPAKTLDFESEPITSLHSDAEFLVESRKLIKELKKLAPADVSSLMGISDKLGTLNYNRYQDWKTPFTPKNARQALFAFKGDVYSGLDAESFSQTDIKFAQKHLRILSGLYGLLKPLDLMQPYRLEMGTRFENKAGKDLYEFWDEKITLRINQELEKDKSQTLLNLASNEYFKVIKTELLNAEIITPVFKDFKNGQFKIISFYAKKARGLMSAWIIKNKISDPEDIKSFKVDGYKFYKSESDQHNWVFKRKLSQ